MHKLSSTDILLGHRDWMMSSLRCQHPSQGCFWEVEWGRGKTTGQGHQESWSLIVTVSLTCYWPWTRQGKLQFLGTSIRWGDWSLRCTLTPNIQNSISERRLPFNIFSVKDHLFPFSSVFLRWNITYMQSWSQILSIRINEFLHMYAPCNNHANQNTELHPR